MKTILHALFGLFAFALIFLSLTASMITEIGYSQGEISEVRAFILDGILLLELILGFTLVLGLSLARTRKGRIIDSKKKRTLWVFSISAFILLPIAYLLSVYAKDDNFNLLYFACQFIEYAFDIVALIFLGLNIRDGGKLVRQSQGDLKRSDI